MAQYTAIFTKPYEDGYENLPSQNTPITAQTLNDKDAAIEHIEDFLDGQEFPIALSDLTEDETHRLVTDTEKNDWNGAVSDISWNQSKDFLLKNLITGYTANTSINNSGAETSNNSACISNKIAVDTYASYILTDDKTASGRFAQCFNGDTYLGYVSVTKGTPFIPNNLQTGCNAIIFQWNQTNEGSILPQNGKVYKNIPSNTELAQISAIGTDESGRTTASKAYAIGEHFYKDGKFCTAIASISSGATLTLNTNYVEGDIADALTVKDVTSEFTLSTDCSWNTGWTKIYKYGNIIKGFLRFTTSSTSENDKTIITVPSKYASIYKFEFLSTLNASWTGNASGILGFSGSANQIKLLSTAWSTNTEVLASFEYLIG